MKSENKEKLRRYAQLKHYIEGRALNYAISTPQTNWQEGCRVYTDSLMDIILDQDSSHINYKKKNKKRRKYLGIKKRKKRDQ